MGDLPSGPVTLLFTDVEGSTRLLHELGATATRTCSPSTGASCGRRSRRHNGTEVDTQGDAFFYRVRLGVTTRSRRRGGGDASSSNPGGCTCGSASNGRAAADERGLCRGAMFHLAARIGAVGHGGQVVVSGATYRELVTGHELIDLGEHRLKDFDDPVPLYQLGARFTSRR